MVEKDATHKVNIKYLGVMVIIKKNYQYTCVVALLHILGVTLKIN